MSSVVSGIGIEASPKETQNDKASRLLLRLFPSLTDLAFLIPLAVLFVFGSGVRWLLSDGDTGWHIRTGDWILQHRQFPYRDLFSFSNSNQTWFAWEWGWDVLSSLIHTHWGLSAIVLANGAVLGLVSVMLYRLVRRHAANDLLALVVTSVALFASSIHWLARPHLISWVFILSFLHLIDRAEAGSRFVLWWTPLLTLLWVNLHGSFFLGQFFLLTYGFAKTFQKWIFPAQPIRSGLRIYFFTALACLSVSFINPYGWHLHEHIVRYILDTAQLKGIAEFRPLGFDAPQSLAFEILLAFAVWAGLKKFTQREWAASLMILIWAHLALKAARNIPVFAFVSAPLIGAQLSSWLEDARNSNAVRWCRAGAASALAFGQQFRSLERVERIPLLPVAALILSAVSLGLIGRNPPVGDFDGRDFPVAARQTIARLPDARVFTFDQWGDYLIYHFFPRRVALVDGRSDFYGAKFGKEWLDATNARYDWHELLSRESINTVLLKTSSPLAAVLKQRPEWRIVFDDGASIVFYNSSGRKTTK